VKTPHSPIPTDTTPQAAAEQERLLANMEPHERLRAALDLSVAVRRMTVARMRNRQPGLSDPEIRDRLIELCYGGVARS
jgi:hypothetical protein